MNIIAAVDSEWGLGKDRDLLVKIPEDMKYFKEMTLGKIIIMGRTTFESLKHPLKDRVNIVLSRDENLKIDGVYIYNSIEDILAKFKNNNEVFIIGGGEVYKQFLPYCQKAYITKIHKTYPADTFMPNLDQNTNWEIVYESNLKMYSGIFYQFCIYER